MRYDALTEIELDDIERPRRRATEELDAMPGPRRDPTSDTQLILRLATEIRRLWAGLDALAAVVGKPRFPR